MGERLRRFKEKLVPKETPGEKLHARVKKLAKKGTFYGRHYVANYTLSPTEDIIARFYPNANYYPVADVCVLLRDEYAQDPEGTPFRITSIYNIEPDGRTLLIEISDTLSIQNIANKHNDKISRTSTGKFDWSSLAGAILDELDENKKKEKEVKSALGIDDKLDDGQIEELLEWVNSKTLKRKR